MKPVEYYARREQTYVKHFFLEKYLERVVYNIGNFADDFVYVDGFSGPWKSKDEDLSDTSFVIATNKLRQVRNGLQKIGKNPRIRCVFIEKDRSNFKALEAAIEELDDLEILALAGEFEDLVPRIIEHVGNAFSLVFIDPTGWKGFGLNRITPLLEHQPGEVIINFMFDYINRFLQHPGPRIAGTFNELFGGPGWDAAVKDRSDREAQILHFYTTRVRAAGRFKFVTSTRILKPTSDRSYFYLVYGTRNLKGLREFRRVESRAAAEQERVRSAAKQNKRIKRTRQTELFSPNSMNTPNSLERERTAGLNAMAADLRLILSTRRRVLYAEILGNLLERPLVYEADIRAIIREMRLANELQIEGLGPRERTPKLDHVLVWGPGRGGKQARSDSNT